MEKSWAWDDDSYYQENELLGYPKEAYTTLEKAEQAKEELEYKCWQHGFDDHNGGGSLWLYFDSLDYQESEFIENKLKEKGFSIKNLNREGYKWLRETIITSKKNKFEALLQKVTKEDWLKFIEE